jgi:hypothetical protein
MVILGLALVVVGVLAILAAVLETEISGDAVDYVVFDVTATGLFLIGLGAGLALMWGFAAMRFGAKRGLARRRENKRLTELSEKLDRVEAERRADGSDKDDVNL